MSLPLHIPAGFLFDEHASAWLFLKYRRTIQRTPMELKDILDTGRFAELARTNRLPKRFSDVNDARRILRDCGFSGELFYGLFTGGAKTLLPDTEYRIDRNYTHEPLLILPVKRQPDLFHQAYKDATELVDELADRLMPLFPDECQMDLLSQIVEATGTIPGTASKKSKRDYTGPNP